MKVQFLLTCTCVLATIKNCSSASIKAPLSIISLDDLSETDRKQLEYLENHYHYPPRPKRSGSGDLLSALSATLGQGIKSKLGMIAKGSAAASTHFSSGSSQGHSQGHSFHHDAHEDYDHKSFDWWSLKKSVLNTLLQAVKAIKGGVIAVKGQLIKGSGYLVSAKGKLISAKGEAITTLGKNIATSAVLVPYHSAEYGSPHEHYHHHHHQEEYGAPSAPGPEYEVPHHHPHHEDKPNAEHAGILILKKIPKHHEDHHHEDHHHDIPEFKPIEPSGPGWGTVVGKFFSASTSLKPGEPAPFSDSSAPGHIHHEHHGHEPPHHHHEEHQEYPPHPSPTNYDASEHPKPPSTNYGSPFEAPPSYLNAAEFGAESKKVPETFTQIPIEQQKQMRDLLKNTPSPLPSELAPISSEGFEDIQFLNPPPQIYPTAGGQYFFDSPTISRKMPAKREKKLKRNFDVVRSISFELGPGGAKRL